MTRRRTNPFTPRRVHEIGIHKAEGATSLRILLQFLAEAVRVPLACGSVGTLTGIALPLSIRFYTDFTIPISACSAVLDPVAAMLIGIAVGTLPAGRAAQFDPVEALRYE